MKDAKQIMSMWPLNMKTDILRHQVPDVNAKQFYLCSKMHLHLHIKCALFLLSLNDVACRVVSNNLEFFHGIFMEQNAVFQKCSSWNNSEFYLFIA